MNQDEVRRLLRFVRFSPTKGRRLTMAWVAYGSGYAREHLSRAAMHGRVSERLAKHVSRTFQSVINGQSQITRSSFAEYDGGADPRGGPRPVRRGNDGRLRSARPLRGTSRANAYLGPHSGRAENAPSRGPHGGGTARIRPRGAGRAKETPAVTNKLNSVKQAFEQVPTNLATIRIDVGRLLTKQLR
jgi:hypothetical protein